MKIFLIAATMKKVDDALSTTTISAEDKSTVMELRQKGEQQHASGMHKESIATLNEALKHLGM